MRRYGRCWFSAERSFPWPGWRSSNPHDRIAINLDVGRFCTQLLQDLGHETVWAHNAEAALIEVERDASRFDAVFSDVMMSGIGGVELA